MLATAILTHRRARLSGDGVFRGLKRYRHYNSHMPVDTTGWAEQGGTEGSAAPPIYVPTQIVPLFATEILGTGRYVTLLAVLH